MLSALLGIIYQGRLPVNAGSIIVLCCSAVIVASLIQLLVSITFCILIMTRITRFMLSRSKQNMRHLRNAIRSTKDMKKNIRGAHILESIKITHTPISVVSGDQHPKRIVKLEEMDVEKAWKKHEDIVEALLQQRNEIFDHRKRIFGEDCNFEDFWRNECKQFADISLLFFYLGTACMLVVTSIYTGTAFDLVYHSRDAAIVSVVMITMSIVISLWLTFYMRRLDPYIAQLNAQIDMEADDSLQRRRSLLGRMIHTSSSFFHKNK
jgi:hypothetical protein